MVSKIGSATTKTFLLVLGIWMGHRRWSKSCPNTGKNGDDPTMPEICPITQPITRFDESKLLTLAKSIGWITIDANVAAAPPHTNGSNAFATPLAALAVIDLLISPFVGADDDATADMMS